MDDFLQQWIEISKAKGSVLCAGVEGLEHEDKFIKDYLAAVEPHVAAFRLNKGASREVIDAAKQIAGGRALVLQDLRDNDLMYADNQVDAVTFSPFLGNLELEVRRAHQNNIGLISICLLANPQYARIKNSYIPIAGSEEEEYDVGSMHIDDYKVTDELLKEIVDGKEEVVGRVKRVCVRQYLQLAFDAWKHGADGIIVAAPSENNHIKSYEVANAARYFKQGVVFVPAVSVKKEDAAVLFDKFDKYRVIANIGKDMMFPNGNLDATASQQAFAAKYYKEALNEARKSVV